MPAKPTKRRLGVLMDGSTKLDDAARTATIPTIDASDIQLSQIDALMRLGFCYVQLPNAKLVETIRTCIATARQFFAQNQQEKAAWEFRGAFSAQSAHRGYALRTGQKNLHVLEQFFLNQMPRMGRTHLRQPMFAK